MEPGPSKGTNETPKNTLLAVKSAHLKAHHRSLLTFLEKLHLLSKNGGGGEYKNNNNTALQFE